MNIFPILALAVNAGAVDVQQPKALADALALTIKPMVASVTVACPPQRTVCTMTFVDKTRATPAELAAKNEAIRKSLFNELNTLEAKLDNDTATDADRNRAIKLLIVISK